MDRNDVFLEYFNNGVCLYFFSCFALGLEKNDPHPLKSKTKKTHSGNFFRPSLAGTMMCPVKKAI